MGKIITPVLPHDLPENWTDNQYVTPGGTEAGLSEQHGFNYLMRQVNNTQKAVNELDVGSAPYSLMYGRHEMSQVGEFSPTVMGWFNSMGTEQVRNFLLIVYVEGSPLEGGEWCLTITKTREDRGHIIAVKYQWDLPTGGVMIKTCSVYDGNLTSWRTISHDVVAPATVE